MPLMLDLEAFVFIRAHNWYGKNQEDEVGGSNNAVCAQKHKLSGSVKTEQTLWKKSVVAQPESNLLPSGL